MKEFMKIHPKIIELYSNTKKDIYQSQIKDDTLSMNKYREKKQEVLQEISNQLGEWWKNLPEEDQNRILENDS